MVAVVIEAAGTGSSAAAPTVCRTIAAYRRRRSTPPSAARTRRPIDHHRPSRGARSGLGDRVRGAVLGLDKVLLLAVAAITGFSLFVIGRSTEDDVASDPRFYLDRQILFVALGVVALAVAMRVNLDHVSRWAWALWAGLLVALAIVYAAGEATRGSNRWIDIGPFSLQPSEFGKVVLMVVLAGIALQRIERVGTVRFTLPPDRRRGAAGGGRVPPAGPRDVPGLRGRGRGDPVPGGRSWTHFAVFGRRSRWCS